MVIIVSISCNFLISVVNVGSGLSVSGSGRVGFKIVGFLSGRVKIIYCRVGLNFRLSYSPLISSSSSVLLFSLDNYGIRIANKLYCHRG